MGLFWRRLIQSFTLIEQDSYWICPQKNWILGVQSTDQEFKIKPLEEK